MEDFKDVMLSEPPARAAAAAASAANASKASAANKSGGGGGANASGSRTIQSNGSRAGGGSSMNTGDTTGADFSAYKGILLCDRPVDRAPLGGGGSHAMGGGDGSVPFLPSGKAGMMEDRALGLPPSVEGRSRLEQQRTAVRLETKGGTATGALARHRRWLMAFARNVRELTENQKDAEDKRELVRQHIREREAVKRAELRNILPSMVNPGRMLKKTPTPTLELEQQQQQQQQQQSPAQPGGLAAPTFQVQSTKQKPPAAAKAAGGKAGAKKKPMWAMTEDEALDAEFEQSRDLLDFASALDYDSFAKDCEIQEAMAIMKQRVREIAAEKKMDIDEIRRQAAEQCAASDGDDDDDNMTVVSVMVAGSDGVERKVHQFKPRRTVAASSVARSNNSAAGGAGDGDAAADDANKPKWDGTTKLSAASFLRGALSAESFVLAEKLLAENPVLRQVHSKHSLSRMLQQVALTGADGGKDLFANTAETQGIPFAGRLVPPVISNIAPEAASSAAVARSHAAGAAADGDEVGGPPAVHRRILVDLRKRKDQTQNLPYLYRHPGI